ncbi:MAG: hypothetical protein A2Y89_05080 [Chloroflexi bacterium RBG_13_51_18]|nr:MAG: hypothetical protein A2Y89_05080 [Chloroflexi bacterium RBG_13_51_18]
MRKLAFLALAVALPVVAYSSFGAIEPIPSPPQPDTVTHEINALYLTLADTWIDNATWPFGDGSDLLYIGYFGVGTPDGFLASYSWGPETDFYGDDDWPTSVPWGDVPPRYGEENYLLYLTDEGGFYPLGLRARQHSFGFHAWPNNDFIYILWTVYNAGDETIQDAAAGLFMDMDIGVDPMDNLAAFEPVNQFAYICDDTSGEAAGLYFGAVTLGDDPTGSFHGWTIYEMLEEYYQECFYGMLSQVGRFQELPQEPNDWRFLLGYQLHDLAPGETQDYAVALVAGEDLLDMIDNVAAARLKWRDIFGGGEPEPSLPSRVTLSAPWPCPARDSASFEVELVEPGDIEVALYDLSGRRVDTIYDGYMAAGRCELTVWTGGLPPGVYLIQAAAEGGASVRRLVVAR